MVGPDIGSFSCHMIGKTIFQILRVLDLMSRPQETTKKEISHCLDISLRSIFHSLISLIDMAFQILVGRH